MPEVPGVPAALDVPDGAAEDRFSDQGSDRFCV